MNNKSSVSIIIPVFNEAAILEKSMQILNDFLVSVHKDFEWEIIMINDGSTDGTKIIADKCAENYKHLRIFHHSKNMGLGMALKTGFVNAKGEYIVVIDVDLSYSPEHITALVNKIKETEADIVVASPYLKGGKVSMVPFSRRVMSRFVNFFMSCVAQTNLRTFTGMVRIYRRAFISTLDLKATSQAINPEIIYKAIILRARIEEIPAHLDWSCQRSFGMKRSSSMRIFSGMLKGLMSAFVFRPYAFFLTVGFMLLMISAYIIIWIFINVFSILPDIIVEADAITGPFSLAVAEVFNARPYSFLIGGITLIVGLQFLSTGFLSLQNKRNFEELFHINTSLLKKGN